MTSTPTLAAQAAAAGRTTREQALEEAHQAYRYDLSIATLHMPSYRENLDVITHQHLDDCEGACDAMKEHIAEMRRHLPSGHVRTLGEGDELAQGGRGREDVRDVREQLIVMLAKKPRDRYGNLQTDKVADAILERFDVAEKPVVTDEALGKMAAKAWYGAKHCSPGPAQLGIRMRDQLEAAGLRIVKVESDK